MITTEERAEVAAALRAHIRAHVAERWGACACPMCGGTAWTHSAFADIALAREPGGVPETTIHASIITCTGCGFAALLNLDNVTVNVA